MMIDVGNEEKLEGGALYTLKFILSNYLLNNTMKHSCSLSPKLVCKERWCSQSFARTGLVYTMRVGGSCATYLNVYLVKRSPLKQHNETLPAKRGGL